MLIAIPTLVALQLACVGSPRPVTTPPAAADSIPEREIQLEMQSVHRHAGYPILLFLVGGGLGVVVGSQVGAALDSEAEPWTGWLVGGLFGGVAGMTGGLVMGTNLAESSRRAEAIRRIKARRAQEAR